MAEWLTLLLLVPAIVVPVVLLLGFAGCDIVFGLHPVSHVPVIESAVGTSVSTITLTWTYGGSSAQIEFERTRLPDPSKPPPSPSDPAYQPKNFFAAFSPYDDTGLERATTYAYRVRAVSGDGHASDWSDTVHGATLAGFAILDIAQDGSFGNVDTKTVKCEIVAADLTAPPFAPARMWITLGQRASADENVTFSKVFIGHKGAAGDAWDATSLTQVLFGGAASTVIMPGNTARSDEIAFAWDRTSALILSMYFAGGPSSDQLSARTTGSSNTYLKDGIDEAALADATGYAPFPGYLSGVVRIEVA